MDLKRIARHLFALPGAVGRALPPKAMSATEEAIKRSEAGHRGEIRLAVEAALGSAALFAGQSARSRALDVFSQLRVWDTEHNNGVLIYLLLAERNIEIVADRGINAKVPAEEWEAICRRMEASLARGEFAQGVIAGIEEVSRHLAQHFPAGAGDANELPDKPVAL
jgi:uncharacterized membrane protein